MASQPILMKNHLSERMKQGLWRNEKRILNLLIENIKTMLSTMNYGSITLVVQDNVVVQIEKNEKIRLK